jgi:hypothetical protein
MAQPDESRLTFFVRAASIGLPTTSIDLLTAIALASGSRDGTAYSAMSVAACRVHVGVLGAIRMPLRTVRPSAVVLKYLKGLRSPTFAKIGQYEFEKLAHLLGFPNAPIIAELGEFVAIAYGFWLGDANLARRREERVYAVNDIAVG